MRRVEKEIDGLYDRLASDLREENLRLREKVKQLTDENAALKIQVKKFTVIMPAMRWHTVSVRRVDCGICRLQSPQRRAYYERNLSWVSPWVWRAAHL